MHVCNELFEFPLLHSLIVELLDKT